MGKKLRKKLAKKVLSGKLTVDEARAELGRRNAQKVTRKNARLEAEARELIRQAEAAPVVPSLKSAWALQGGELVEASRLAAYRNKDMACEDVLAAAATGDHWKELQAYIRASGAIDHAAGVRKSMGTAKSDTRQRISAEELYRKRPFTGGQL